MMVAVLDGSEREILLSLDKLKSWNLIHASFPNQTVLDFIQSKYNKGSFIQSEHSFNESAKVSKHDECEALKQRTMDNFKTSFKEKLTPQDRVSVPPVHLCQNPEKTSNS